MGSKVFTIERPKLAFLDTIAPKEELQIIFTWSKPKLGKRGYQTVTSCLIRSGLKQLGVGISIENLNDERDDTVGMRWAYKRAVYSLMRNFTSTSPIIFIFMKTNYLINELFSSFSTVRIM